MFARAGAGPAGAVGQMLAAGGTEGLPASAQAPALPESWGESPGGEVSCLAALELQEGKAELFDLCIQKCF